VKEFSQRGIESDCNPAQGAEPNVELTCLQLADQRLSETSCVSQFLLCQAFTKPKTPQIARQCLPRGMNVSPNHTERGTSEALAIYT
jgi:hypothetical protein